MYVWGELTFGGDIYGLRIGVLCVIFITKHLNRLGENYYEG